MKKEQSIDDGISQNMATSGLTKVKPANCSIEFIGKDCVNKEFKCRKRIITEYIQINRIYHDVVPCDEEHDYKENSWKEFIRKSEGNEVESLHISETSKPRGTTTLSGYCFHGCDNPPERQSSLIGRIPKRRKQ